MSKAEIKNCPRCGEEFECNSSTMLLCQCNQIELPEDVMEQLAEDYEDCLCLGCLRSIINAYKKSV